MRTVQVEELNLIWYPPVIGDYSDFMDPIVYKRIGDDAWTYNDENLPLKIYIECTDGEWDAIYTREQFLKWYRWYLEVNSCSKDVAEFEGNTFLEKIFNQLNRNTYSFELCEATEEDERARENMKYENIIKRFRDNN